MPNAIKQLMEKIDARVIRERVLIFITLLAIIFLLWDFLLQGRFDKARKALEAETQRVTAEQTTVEARIAELTLALTSDPAIIRSTEITDLHRRIAEAEALLSGLSQGLISANQLPEALEDVLQKTSTVNVLQVRTLPASELHLETKTQPVAAINATAVEEGGTGVYKHAVLIRISGSFIEVLQLMKEIESLPWKFYWESLDYRVTRYPEATIDIRVFTLSSEEGLLGV